MDLGGGWVKPRTSKTRPSRSGLDVGFYRGPQGGGVREMATPEGLKKAVDMKLTVFGTIFGGGHKKVPMKTRFSGVDNLTLDMFGSNVR